MSLIVSSEVRHCKETTHDFSHPITTYARARSLRLAYEANGHGLVHTVGAHKGASAAAAFEARQMQHGLVLNRDGAPSPVVHQFDRLVAPLSAPLRLRLAALSAAVDEANHSAALRCRFAQKGSTSLMRIASGGKATQLVCE